MSEYPLLDHVINAALIDTEFSIEEAHWQSDWNGDEVGYPEILVVGLYSMNDEPISFYIDTESGLILEAWYDGEC